ncbi:MAG: hypothetical protein GX758_02165 [Tenericutes bacterium]|nr:hypothetical protein [Mycoplasmatota bacterium]
MKKIIYTALLFILLICIPYNIKAEEKTLNLYLFYGDGCPHCKDEEDFLDKYLKENKNVKLYKYEVWYSEENREKLNDVKEILDYSSNGVPFLVIGNSALVGFGKNSSEEKIKNTINYYMEQKFKDKVGIYLGLVEETEENYLDSSYIDEEVTVPIIGNKKASEVPLLLSAILIGTVDGINPCAMWILLFLISMLLGMNNKKRMWALGITFLVSSAAVYFLFLISWLNLAIFLNKIAYIRIGISIIASTFGIYAITKFFFGKKDDGCEVVDSKNRKRIIHSIGKIVKEKSFIIALVGIVALAAAVNVIELLCSLGLPVTFIQILSINEVNKTGQILYSLLYVLFFLLDDIIIFTIAMKTLEIKAISNKFGKYSHLIGGIIMLTIGILILKKPEWLMFNFK